MLGLIGANLGQYKIIEQIGAGAQATVYRAYQPSTDRYVAVKVLSHQFSADPGLVQRFKQEARLVARLEHAHILPVYDFGEDKGVVYLAMRYLEAGTLKDIMLERQLPLRETTHLVCQIAGALDYAHRQGVVHRDIKPANIMIDREGNSYLTDFGVAKIVESTGGLTASGTIGTPAYMSPEQGMSGRIDGRTDLYAMGVVLYQMVTGILPFDADTAMGVILSHINEPPPPIVERFPEVPQAVEDVIMKALEKNPDERFQSGSDYCAALRAATGMSSSAQIDLSELRAGAQSALETLAARRKTTVPQQGVTKPSSGTWTQTGGQRVALFGLGGLALLVVAGVVTLVALGILTFNGNGSNGKAANLPPTADGASAGGGGDTSTDGGGGDETPTDTGQPADSGGGGDTPPKDTGEAPFIPNGEMPFVADFEHPNSLDSWAVGGDWQITNDRGNYALFSDVVDSRLTVLGNLNPTPQWVAADSYVISWRAKLDLGGAARLLFSQSSNDDYYAVDFSGANLTLQRIENGQNTTAQVQNTGIPLELGRWYDLTVWRDGPYITLYINDQWVLQILDQPSLPNGLISLETTGSGGVFVDEISVSVPHEASTHFQDLNIPDTWTTVNDLRLDNGNNSQVLAGRNLDTDEIGPITGDLMDFTLMCEMQIRQGSGALQFRKTSGGHYEVLFEQGHVFLDHVVNRGDDIRLSEARNVYGSSVPRTLIVEARGEHLRVLVSGRVVADMDDPGGLASGTIALEFGENSDMFVDDCVIFEPKLPSNVDARFAYDLWQSMWDAFSTTAKPGRTDDFDSQCGECWMADDGTPGATTGPGEYVSEGDNIIYRITGGDSDAWWLFNTAQTLMQPTIADGKTSTNFITTTDVRVTPADGGEASAWVGVRAATSFAGTGLDQIRVRLTTGPDGNTVTVEAAGAVNQEVYATRSWPGFADAAGGWHEVMIVANGDKAAFFVNGTFIVTVDITDDDRLLGTLALGASPGSVADYDNVEVWDLRGLTEPYRGYP